MTQSTIYIPGNVPSSKNSKQWTGRMLISSKQVRNYISNTQDHWMLNKTTFLKMIEGKEKPYRIHFKFIRDSKRRFDYINPMQTVQDLMVKYQWIEDDSADHILPVIEPYGYMKNDGGVEIFL